MMRHGVANAKAKEWDEREADLVDRLKARSSEAWTEAFTRHHRTIFRYIHARVFDSSTTEDLASAVFLEAMRGIDAYQYRGRPVLAWLYRISRNVVSDHQRKLLGRPYPLRVLRSVIGSTSTAESLDAPARTADSADEPQLLVERMDLRSALRTLTGAQREVVILRFFVGLDTPEIAAMLGKAPAATYSLEARALAALRKQLR